MPSAPDAGKPEAGKIPCDEEFAVQLPEESRNETRVPILHSNAQWRNRLREYHYRCAYCGITGRNTAQGYLERDHVMPITRGGTDVIENIVPACHVCNQVKGRARPGERVWTVDFTRRVAVPDPKQRRRHRRWYL